MDLSIIIVNWNSKAYLRKCLDSLFRETKGLRFEVIVIDSGSLDGCGEMLAHDYPRVSFIQSSENLGFARANNEAVIQASGEILLFLNPDTEFASPAINILFDAFLALLNPGAVGAKLLNSDGTLQTSSIQAFPTVLNQVLNVDIIRNQFPNAGLWGTAPLFKQVETISEIDVISGACLMMRRSVFEKIGGFSTEYFMYSEDVDLCYKTHKANLKNYYVPHAVVTHHGGGSSTEHGVSAFASVMMLESRWRFFRKTRSLSYGWLYRLAMLAISSIRIALVVLVLPYFVLSKKARWIPVLRKWNARLRWALGLERWASAYGR